MTDAGRQEQGHTGNNARRRGSQATAVPSFVLQRFANLADTLITTGTATLSGRISWATWLCSCMVVQMTLRSGEIRHLQMRRSWAVFQWHRHRYLGTVWGGPCHPLSFWHGVWSCTQKVWGCAEKAVLPTVRGLILQECEEANSPSHGLLYPPQSASQGSRPRGLNDLFCLFAHPGSAVIMK